MKTIFLKIKIQLVVIFLIIANVSISQNQYWSEPQLMSDSITDNNNPVIILKQGYGGELGLMFYEKSTNDGSTAIYMQNLNFPGEEIEVFAETGVHFRNPQFIQSNSYSDNPDTLFCMLFESDKNGQFDVWQTKYSEDGNFTEPVMVFNAQNNINHLHINGYKIVWEDSGQIFYSFLEDTGNYNFAEPSVIDSGNCESPVVNYYAIAYLKEENDSLRLWNVVFENMNTWSDPEVLYANGNNESLSIINGDSFVEDINMIMWESRNNDQWEILSYDFNSGNFSDFDLSSGLKFHPTGLYFDVITKSYPNFAFLAYNMYENESENIFVNENYNWFQNFLNLTDNTTEDTKPYINIGRKFFSSYHIFLIWKSWVNNHWQLWYSSRQFVMEVDETKLSGQDNLFRVFPNPASKILNLTVANNEKVKNIIVYNQFGQKVIEAQQAGSSINISQLSRGIYFIEVETDKRRVGERFIVE